MEAIHGHFPLRHVLFKFRVFFAQAQAQAEQSSYNKGQETMLNPSPQELLPFRAETTTFQG
jgi:hypothetical protein